MQTSIEVMGYIAAFCTTAAFIPQVLLVWRQRSASGISMAMYLSFCFGVFLWLCYGLVIRAWPLAINNAITLALASSVLVMKWRFDRAPAAATAAISAVATPLDAAR
jgi:MtN3 and saliva related transmembrane protein